MTNEELRDKLKEVTTSLIEHCDAVIILASVNDDDMDYVEYSYKGSYHTCLGLMEDFKLKKSTEHLEQKN
jgi:hypothetical protein